MTDLFNAADHADRRAISFHGWPTMKLRPVGSQNGQPTSIAGTDRE